MSTFKALRVHADGGATTARFETLSLADLSDGEVVVRVCWSGINYKDALAVTGKGPIIRGFPRVPGVDLAGIVEHSSDPAHRAGDRVLVTGCGIGESLDGGYAERARVAASAVIPLPDGLTLREAMAIGTAGFTAAFALQRLLDNRLAPELGPVAVTGPTGGVGSFAIDQLKRAGFDVHAISGKADGAADYLRGLGADVVVDRHSLERGDWPLEAMQWGGAVDNLGGEMLSWLLRTTRPFGSVVSVGLAQSATLPVTVMPFILRGVSLLGISASSCPRDWREALWRQLAGPRRPRILDRIVSREIALDDVPAACAEMLGGALRGRTLVKIGNEA